MQISHFRAVTPASEVEILRYWGAIGLLILGDKASPAREDMLTALARQTSPHVRIQRSEALAKLGDADQAVPVLIALAQPALPWQIRLHALNALRFIGKAVLPALDMATVAMNGDQVFLKSAGKYLVMTLTDRYTPSTQIFDWEGLLA